MLNHNKSGKLIVFEGADGSGKSTQAQKVHEYCQKNGIPAIMTMEPGGTKLGHMIKEILHGDMDIDPYANLGLILAARAQHIKEVVRPALEKGILVISDRGPLSTFMYQIIGKQLPVSVVAVLNKVSMHGIIPSATIVFTVSLEEALKRTMDRDGKHSPYEKSESYARVVEGYNKLASGRLSVDKSFIGHKLVSFSSENSYPSALTQQVVISMTRMGFLENKRDVREEI